ncbi:mannitol dehydrogenase family protein [Sulfitobacter sp. S0837]|uniref:mannitol dehydrogenase family protein n=1 Tax=Sulfitobacter maritimus TaxID=2741719 RepID=UPI00158247B7|nr:mannitol dehydrogenase family protein [Sulfitobacter maritimus]NUH64364.1 mannitol dehydrogenase family protein [Sulfitobacter maritimus]
MTTDLSLSTLSQLPQRVSVPSYDRAQLSPGILHIGMGNFHRAHQAAYLDRLFDLGVDHDWAIVGAGVMPFDAERRAMLQAQDWLTTVVELSPETYAARVTGAMIDFCPIDAQAIIQRIADPAIRIVSLTITEGGYFIDAATGEFDAAHPDIRQDAAAPDDPVTVFGILLAGLRQRRERGHPPPTILSCDNIPENGHVTRQALAGLAGLICPEVQGWVMDEVAFPNSMVDRITPATSAAKRTMVAETFGIIDAAPVVCEPFTQWVMEDNFPLGRPSLEKVGVQFVDDIAAYETMKLRILNASHAALSYPAALMGHDCVHDAVADRDIFDWVQQLMRTEVIPVLAPIPGVDYDHYLATCLDRFANPEVRDTIARLCQDGSNRQPKFILPTITDALAQGRPLDGLALEVALWCRYCAESDALDDPRADRLREAARHAQQSPAGFLALTDVFGTLGQQDRFAQAFARQVEAVWNGDARSVLRGFLDRKAA